MPLIFAIIIGAIATALVQTLVREWPLTVQTLGLFPGALILAQLSFWVLFAPSWLIARRVGLDVWWAAALLGGLVWPIGILLTMRLLFDATLPAEHTTLLSWLRVEFVAGALGGMAVWFTLKVSNNTKRAA